MRKNLFAFLIAAALAIASPLACAQLTTNQANALSEKIEAGDIKALATLKQKATRGDAKAQVNLGTLYFYGKSVPKSSKEAVKWFRLAAKQGKAEAQYELGTMYSIGEGVPLDFKESAKWYRLAANQGHATSQSILGFRFAKGLGVPSNKIAAYALFGLAMANDPSDANYSKDGQTDLVKNMAANEIKTAEDLTREMAKTGNLLNALDQYIQKSPITGPSKPLETDALTSNLLKALDQYNQQTANNESSKPVATAAISGAPNHSYPVRPAKVPGVVSCNTRCMNAACFRTYDDGRKVKFQAEQKWNPLTNQFEFDSGSC
jgi:TPR repeat protein